MPTYSPLHIVIGSLNPVKGNAAQRAFQRFFPQREVHLHAVEASSGVSAQPYGDEETQRGARQRALAARKRHPQADFWIGMEGGVVQQDAATYAFAWMAVLDTHNRWGIARSAAFLLPPRVAALLAEGYELGEADDIVFGTENSKHAQGAIGLLTGGLIDRTALYEHALLAALIPFGPWATLYHP